MADAQVFHTPAQLRYFHLCALKGAVKLEQKGLKRRGRSALSIAKNEFNLDPTWSYDQVMDHLDLAMQGVLAARLAEVNVERNVIDQG